MAGNLNRRQYLGAIGSTAAVASLAGCSDDAEGSTQISVGGGGSSASSFQILQAIQSVLAEESDSASLSVQATGGDPQNIRVYDQGEIDAYSAGEFIVANARNGDPPFDESPVENFPYQGFGIQSINMYWISLTGSEIETTDDLVGRDVWAFPPSWGFRSLLVNILTNLGVWEDIEPNVVNVGLGDVASTIEEGNIEALPAYTTNFSILPSWLVEVDSRAEVQLVEHTDDYVQAIEDTAGTSHAEIDLAGWDQDLGADSTSSWSQTYQLYFGESVPDDAVGEVMRVCHEHSDQIQESQSGYLDQSNLENMTFPLHSEMPVHPGAAAFYRENDVWNDSWHEPSA